MKTTIAIIKFETFRLLRNFSPVFFALAFPTIMLTIFGNLYGNNTAEYFGGKRILDFSVPSYLVLGIAVTGLMSFPLGLAEYRDKKILKQFSTTPMKAWKILFAQAVANISLTIAGAILLVSVGYFVFHLHLPVSWWKVLVIFLLGNLTIYAFGSLIAALASSERAATVIANLCYFPMIFFSGATVPANLLPETVKHVSSFLPTTWVVKLLQYAWLSTSENVAFLIICLVGVSVFCGALAIWLFRWE